MKWPYTLALVRHGESKFNKAKKVLEAHPKWKAFVDEFNKNYRSRKVKNMARELLKLFPASYCDYTTPLTASGRIQAIEAGKYLATLIPPPNVAITSPYLRCRDTLSRMRKGWPAGLGVFGVPTAVPHYTDELLVERDVGLRAAYFHWRIFYALHPEQKAFYDHFGDLAYYCYRFPQGENMHDVRFRIRKWLDTLVREYAEKNVLVVTHHITILAIRANLERMTPEEFLKLDKENPPKNCSITIYRGDPALGKDGRLVLERYNEIAPS